MQDKIHKILEAGITAPSGENCQPWLVRVFDAKIEVYNDPLKDTSLYNTNQLGSMASIGAFLENVVITSRTEGLTAIITLFPDTHNPDFVAIVNFSPTQSAEDPLYEAIFKRCTNRKPYAKSALSSEQRNQILTSAMEIGGAEVRLIEDPAAIASLAGPISLNEQLIFENPLLHKFFYDHIRWNAEEDKKYKNGFYIKTLELQPPQKAALTLLKHWSINNFARKLGMSKQIAKDNAKSYAASAALGVVLVPKNTRADFVLGGRVFERLWLKAASMGLSLQPTTGVVFFKQRLLAGEAKEFQASEIQAIENAYQKISEKFANGNQTIAAVFRIGQGGEPSARSSKFDLSQIIIS